MTSKLANMPIGRLGFGERELLLVAAAFLSLKDHSQPPTLDWVKFTQLCGYGSTDSARVCFRPLQKKLKEFVDNLGDSSKSSKVPGKCKLPKAPRTARPSKTPRPGGPSERTRETLVPGSEFEAGGNLKKRKLQETDMEVTNVPIRSGFGDWKYDEENPGGKDFQGHAGAEEASDNSTAADGI